MESLTSVLTESAGEGFEDRTGTGLSTRLLSSPRLKPSTFIHAFLEKGWQSVITSYVYSFQEISPSPLPVFDMLDEIWCDFYADLFSVESGLYFGDKLFFQIKI